MSVKIVVEGQSVAEPTDTFGTTTVVAGHPYHWHVGVTGRLELAHGPSASSIAEATDGAPVTLAQIQARTGCACNVEVPE